MNLHHISELIRDKTKHLKMMKEDVLKRQDMVGLLWFFSELRNGIEAVRIARKELDDLEDELSHKTIPDIMKSNGVKTINVDGIGRISISYRYSCTMIDRQLGMNWLKENGYGSLVIETVNSQTLASFAKDMLVNEGKELPPDKFKVSTSPFTSITRS